MLRPASCLIIGNPENRRVALFQAALQQAGAAPALVLPYRDLLAQIDQPLLPGTDGADGLAAHIAAYFADHVAAGVTVRIESPGENFAVEQKILALGGVENALQLADERGRIYHPKQWFLGFSRLMDSIAQGAGAASWFNHPADIVTMFNKPLCKRLLRPHTLESCPDFSSYDAFFSFVEQQPRQRFFIKLFSSSSASGIVAYEYNRSNGREQAYSTVEVVETKGQDCFYNSLKIKKYGARGMIKKILDFLFSEGALVEPWIPKAKHADWSYDLRVMAIGGRRCHALARLSHGPMTNLHLGNQRCSTDALNLPAETWAKIDTLVEQTMQHFPRSLYAGLDVLLPRSGQDPVLLEVNAFGDLLPNLLHQGKSTYLAEIEALPAKAERGGLWA